MERELMLAAFIMGLGLCVAGAGTHLYQALARQQAVLRIDGKTLPSAIGHLAMSVVCGPYIMLHMGWQHDEDGAQSMAFSLIGALVAFGWAFVTGLFFLSLYVAFLR